MSTKMKTTKDKILAESIALSKKLNPIDYFSIGFGAIIGVGWVMVIGDWIDIGGGPLVAMLAFLAGALIIIPIALIYGQLTSVMPVAGGAVAFTLRAMGSFPSYITGWFLVLGYIMLCPWETIAIGHLLEALFPALKTAALYTIGNYTVYAPSLSLSLLISLVIILINFRGIEYVAKIQKVLTACIALIGTAAIVLSICKGDWGNLLPFVANTPQNPGLGFMMGMLSVLAITPFFYSGFDTIPQEAEECSENIDTSKLGKVIFLSVLSAGLFYTVIIMAVSMIMPWQDVLKLSLPSASVYELGIEMPLFGKAILIAGLCGLISTLNSFFVAGARVILALGRAGLINPVFTKLHPRYRTPFICNILIAVVTLAGPFFGKSLLLPITNVCSLGFMFAWFMVCLSGVIIRWRYPDKMNSLSKHVGKKTGYLAVTLSFLMILLLILPYSPGALKWPLEWGIVGFWLVVGMVLYFMNVSKGLYSEEERCRIVLGKYFDEMNL